MRFSIKNVGRVAAYKWHLSIHKENSDKDYYLGETNEIPRESMTRQENTILPGCELTESIYCLCFLRPKTLTTEAIKAEIETKMLARPVYYQLATETSPGELQKIELNSIANVDELTDDIMHSLRNRGVVKEE